MITVEGVFRAAPPFKAQPEMFIVKAQQPGNGAEQRSQHESTGKRPG
jgi:hypothetical protein